MRSSPPLSTNLNGNQEDMTRFGDLDPEDEVCGIFP